jgi:hypothetical protein
MRATHPDPWIYHTNLLSLGHLGHEYQAHGLGTLSFIVGFLELLFSLLDSFPGGLDMSREVFLDDFNNAPVEELRAFVIGFLPRWANRLRARYGRPGSVKMFQRN